MVFQLFFNSGEIKREAPFSHVHKNSDAPRKRIQAFFHLKASGSKSYSSNNWITMTLETDPKKIAARLCEFARTNFVAEGQEFDENSPLSQAGIDSFALVELLLFCERNIGVRVPDSHLTGANLTSMFTLAACISELARNGHASS